ncbi:MAG: N-acetylglutamate synthase-like GNAT family acetyltransferase [Arcticibacterium sp.]|jgi:N-acetylglutamate synthase-like GNAT family acetyltransferase
MIREARINDIESIIGIWAKDKNSNGLEMLSRPLSSQYINAYSKIKEDENQYLMVFEQNGEVIGMLQLTLIQYLFRQARKVALIEAVIVKESDRGVGIGEKLIRWAIEKARQDGANLVQLTSNKNRPRSLDFYEKLGFSRSHEGFKLKINE